VRSMLVTWTKSYLCESVLVQKALTELGAPDGLRGMQPVRASNGRNGEASQRYFAGRRVGRSDVRASALWAKHRIEPPSSVRGDRLCGYRLRLLRCMTLSCGDKGSHSHQMKSLAVPDQTWNRANAVYKAMPKGPVTRRIREAVSGSADLRDGSRAVVASPFWGVKRETVLSEHAEFGVDMGKLAARLKPPIGPPGPLSGNPAHPLRNVSQYPSNVVCGSVETGDSHVQNH